MKTDAELFAELQQVANEKFDGHFTLMKFTTNWRVCFGTPDKRPDIRLMPVGETFAEAAQKAIETLACAYEFDHGGDPDEQELLAIERAFLDAAIAAGLERDESQATIQSAIKGAERQ